MIDEVNYVDSTAWRNLAHEMSLNLRHQIQHTSVGHVIGQLLGAQTDLITSLPTVAAQRVQLLSMQSFVSGTRYAKLQAEIEETGEVTESRAKLIARTEVARAATTFTQARAESVGSTHYIWHTMDDSTVRPGHAAMEGQICEWRDPPAVMEGKRVYYHHPGCIWNCRCYAEPIINLH